MLRLAEERAGGGLLDDVTGVHHRHPLARLGHDAQVVGDEHHRRAQVGLQRSDQVEDLRLDGHVERSRRLVGDEQLGAGGQRHGDHHPLRLAARELVGVRAGPAAGIGDADPIEHLDGSFLAGLALEALVHLVDLGDLEADPVGRVQRRDRLLEDHADAVAAHVAHLGLRLGQQLLAGEAHRAAHDAPGLVDEPQHRERGHALARARLADEAEDLARQHVEVDPVDGLHDAVPGEEPGTQVAHRQERLAPRVAHRFNRGSRASRRPSPMRLNDRTFIMIISPG
jgi:hypothetical protein